MIDLDTTNSTPAITIKERLQKIVKHLSDKIGERNLNQYQALNDAASYLQESFKTAGYKVERQTFQVNGFDCHNLIVEVQGTEYPDEIIVIGAHYDSALGTPGANDNGSGTAALLVIAEELKSWKPQRTVRFVAFTNEEPPYFQRDGQMGSWVYARSCRQRNDNLVGVISLETVGYFSDEANSQKYPPLLAAFYPDTGNFIGFVSNLESREFLQQVHKIFREHSDVPAEVASLPSAIQGVGWSDHWSFWQEGYVGLMVTDTAPFRYPHYHEPTDTIDKIDFTRFAKVVDGLIPVVKELAAVGPHLSPLHKD